MWNDLIAMIDAQAWYVVLSIAFVAIVLVAYVYARDHAARESAETIAKALKNGELQSVVMQPALMQYSETQVPKRRDAHRVSTPVDGNRAFIRLVVFNGETVTEGQGKKWTLMSHDRQLGEFDPNCPAPKHIREIFERISLSAPGEAAACAQYLLRYGSSLGLAVKKSTKDLGMIVVTAEKSGSG